MMIQPTNLSGRLPALLVAVILSIPATCLAGFDEYFTARTFRIDYMHTGNKDTELYSINKISIEPFWGGHRTNLIDTLRYGSYFFQAYDVASGKLIYSRGYSTLFAEWRTTAEAAVTTWSFAETVVMPLPRQDVRVEFLSRDKQGFFEKKFEYVVRPADPFVSAERTLEYPVFDVVVTGDPSVKVDIVILPEGYKADELEQFREDCRKFTGILFSFSPYAEYKDRFNIRGVLAPSADSGSDIPPDSVWKKTILNSSYYTFNSERYCMTYDNKSVRDLAANAPYDQIYILLNSTRYGGGAIYNHYSMSVNSNLYAAKIFIHEFGHGFAGLGDEYYDASTSYIDFYPAGVEPWEPNLTTLVDFGKKWRHLVDKDTPVPTPDTEVYSSVTGVFEGGGYVARGVYRPAHDCLMNTFDGDTFCAACKEAIITMIRFYTE